MRTGLLLTFLLAAIYCSAQRYDPEFSRIDQRVQFIDAATPAALATALTAGYQKDLYKVRAIFRWITLHIDYYRAVPARRRSVNNVTDVFEESDTLFPLNERVARKVLADRQTHCEGYARLFTSLCEHAGIPSTVVSGYGRTESSRGGNRFRSNHSWNAVYIDSSWHLLDVTWASGFITYSTENFVRQYNDYFFLTPPEEFSSHHYPDDLRWTLLSEPPAIDEFQRTPFRQRSFSKYTIQNFSPARGIIQAAVGDTIRIQLKTGQLGREVTIAPDSLWDSSYIVRTPVVAYVSPDANSAFDNPQYTFIVPSDRVMWLHVMYNNDAVLRYRLEIKQPSVIAKR